MAKKAGTRTTSQRKRKTIQPLGIKMDLDLKDLGKSISKLSDDLGKKVDKTVKDITKQVSRVISEELKVLKKRFSRIEKRLEEYRAIGRERLSRPGKVKPVPKPKVKKAKPTPKAKAKKAKIAKTCSVRGCNKPYAAKGMCKNHYMQMLYKKKKGIKAASKASKPVSKKGVKGKRTCTVEGCNNPYLARGYCKKHYEQWRKGKLR